MLQGGRAAPPTAPPAPPERQVELVAPKEMLYLGLSKCALTAGNVSLLKIAPRTRQPSHHPPRARRRVHAAGNVGALTVVCAWLRGAAD